MSSKTGLSQILSRKIISAAISGSIFAILLGLFMPNPFGEDIQSTGAYLRAFFIAVPAYLMYSFPVILLYGTITSTVSEYIARFILKYTRKNMKLFFSFILHMLFGLVLLWYSLTASLLFFMTDYIISRRNHYKWSNALKSLCIPIFVWLVFMGIVYLID